PTACPRPKPPRSTPTCSNSFKADGHGDAESNSRRRTPNRGRFPALKEFRLASRRPRCRHRDGPLRLASLTGTRARVHYASSRLGAAAVSRRPQMITKFDSLFAGHVDMDNVGYGGIPVNERRLPDEQLTTVFDKAEVMAKLMDRLGYSTFWMAEHH